MKNQIFVTITVDILEVLPGFAGPTVNVRFTSPLEPQSSMIHPRYIKVIRREESNVDDAPFGSTVQRGYFTEGANRDQYGNGDPSETEGHESVRRYIRVTHARATGIAGRIECEETKTVRHPDFAAWLETDVMSVIGRVEFPCNLYVDVRSV